jgi:hypothetical protein
MPLIAGYTGLVEAVESTLNRTDITGDIGAFVVLAEAAMNRRLRSPEMVKRASVDIFDEYVDRPLDWLETIRYQVDTNPITVMEFVTPEEAIIQKTKYSASGIPKFYSMVGIQFQHVPAPDVSRAGELLYYSSLPPLNLWGTNWLLKTSPDLYLYATLAHSAPFLKEDERLNTWVGIYDRLMAEQEVRDQRAKTGSSRLAAKIRTFG